VSDVSSLNILTKLSFVLQRIASRPNRPSIYLLTFIEIIISTNRHISPIKERVTLNIKGLIEVSFWVKNWVLLALFMNGLHYHHIVFLHKLENFAFIFSSISGEVSTY